MIYFFLAWIVGLFVTSFTIIQVLTILFFGIPTTRSLTKSGQLIKNNGIIKKYLISMVFLLFFFLLITLMVLGFFPDIFSGYVFGGGMALLFGLGKVGANEDNMSDYVQSNKEHFDKNAPDIFSRIIDKNENVQQELERVVANMQPSDPAFSQKMGAATVEALKKATLDK